MTLKNELQATLEQATRALGELRQSSAAERDSLESLLEKERSAWEAKAAELRAANQELASESGERGRQLETTRLLFSKTRDQLRLDQASLDSLRAVNRRYPSRLTSRRYWLRTHL